MSIAFNDRPRPVDPGRTPERTMNEDPAPVRRQPVPAEARGRVERAGSRPGSSCYADWEAFVRFCEDLRFGEIERLKIQDGRPVLAEVVKKKVKFTR